MLNKKFGHLIILFIMLYLYTGISNAQVATCYDRTEAGENWAEENPVFTVKWTLDVDTSEMKGNTSNTRLVMSIKKLNLNSVVIDDEHRTIITVKDEEGIRRHRLVHAWGTVDIDNSVQNWSFYQAKYANEMGIDSRKDLQKGLWRLKVYKDKKINKNKDYICGIMDED
ncbi:MAG: hypothetical protein K0R49_280 [Burkholderiales bacterium]|jgi:hypothetical protein|nr:hypothetical protein [Burkholderiales bacterium]